MQHISKGLEYFGNRVINRSKSALTQKKKNVSKELYNSLRYDISQDSKGYSISFYMLDYGKFIDKGVKGRDSSKKAPNSPYKFRDKMPPPKSLDQWVVRRGIRGTRNEKGQFVKRDSIKYAIAKNIQKFGIQETGFFTTSFENAYKRLPDDIASAYAESLNI